MSEEKPDYGIPLSYLRIERRRLVEQLAELKHLPTAEQLQVIASLQIAIAAAEAVIAEKDKEAPSFYEENGVRFV